MAIARTAGLVTVAAIAALVAGCGSGGRSSARRSHSTTASSSSTTVRADQEGPEPAPTGIAPNPSAVRVIRAWSSALRAGNLRRAASFFAIPSVMLNVDLGGDLGVTTILSRKQAVAVNATLPCGSQFISADQRGDFTNVLFRLTDRRGPGSDCGSVGLTARTNFVVMRGHILEWSRARDDPGDNRYRPSPPRPLLPRARKDSIPVA